MSDSDSSDNEEHIRALKESEANFASNLYSTNNAEQLEDSKSKSSFPKSLRYDDDDVLDEDKTVGPCFTKGVQKYIAKQLSSILDQQLEEVHHTKQKVKKTAIGKDCGINLLSGSRTLLSAEDVVDISVAHNNKCKRRRNETNNDEETKKLKESAVSADWLLSGEAIKGWEKNTKGEVIPGVLKDSVINKKKKRKKKKKALDLETV